jgi:glutamate synthase domain-containing protein 3
VAYVLDRHGRFAQCCNTGMVELEPLADEDWELVRGMVGRHVEHTRSLYAAHILADLDAQPFVKVMPRDYRRVLQAEAKARAEHREPDFAELVGAVSG